MALQKLGKYEIVSEIGRGAMGVVYKAFDPILEREVALKTMMASMGGMDGEGKARFYREARSAAKLTHRNIVTIYDMGEEQGIPYIAMEFLDGVDLHRKMKREGPLPLREALDITAQVLKGLSYAHQFQIVHRDIKPANIYILKNGTAKILDFGIAKLAISEMTRTGMVLGTVDYMSPEQIRADKGVDGRSDLFSVGVILYELLQGRKPFPGETITQIMFKIVHDQPAEFGTEREMPSRLAEVTKKSLEKEPAKRYQNGEEFARDLEQVIMLIDAEVTTVRQMAPESMDVKESVTAARRLFEGGSFDDSAKMLKSVLAKHPGHKEAAELLTQIDRRVGAEATVQLEAEPESPRPSAPRGSRIEEILAEIEQERKTSPGAAGRSERGVPDLTVRLEDSGVKEPAEPAAPPPRIETKAPPVTGRAPAAPARTQAPATPQAPPRTEAKPAASPSPPKPEPKAPPRPPSSRFEARPPERPAERKEEKAPAAAKAPAPPKAAEKKAGRPEPARADRATEELFPPEKPARGAARRAERAEEAPSISGTKKGLSPVLIGGAVAALVIVAVGGWLLFGRGSSTTATPASSSGATSTGSAPATAPPGPQGSGAPPPPAASASGFVALDALPWAEVTAVRDSSGRSLTLPSDPGGSRPTTPVVLELPAGRYEIVLKHPDYAEVTLRDVSVTSGQWTKLSPAMPGFAPKLPASSP